MSDNFPEHWPWFHGIVDEQEGYGSSDQRISNHAPALRLHGPKEQAPAGSTSRVADIWLRVTAQCSSLYQYQIHTHTTQSWDFHGRFAGASAGVGHVALSFFLFPFDQFPPTQMLGEIFWHWLFNYLFFLFPFTLLLTFLVSCSYHWTSSTREIIKEPLLH